MKLLCIALLALLGHQALAIRLWPSGLGHQALANSRRKEQASIFNYEQIKNIKGCKEGEFRCDSNLCVSEEKRCDGRVNCADGTDEVKCDKGNMVDETMDRNSHQNCGAEYSHISGTIVHPVGGGNYHNYEDCVWIIRAGLPMRIVFTHLQVEANYDLLTIRDGDSPDSGVIGQFSGHEIPHLVETNGNASYITFTSYYSVNFTGFELHWAPSECPSPWVRIGLQCFFVSVGLTWASAKDYCEGAAPGGTLAQPNNLNVLVDYLDENYEGLDLWWLGGSDLSNEGDWLWLNGTSIASTDWYQNQPDGGDCLVMGSWPGYDRRLYSSDCGTVLFFVCERH